MTDVDILFQSANQPVSLTNGLGGTNHQPPILVSVNSSGRTLESKPTGVINSRLTIYYSSWGGSKSS